VTSSMSATPLWLNQSTSSRSNFATAMACIQNSGIHYPGGGGAG
jgi:hypothetical protein